LVRADRQTPSWQKEIGRQFRVGYYSRKDGLDCIWLVNERGKYEQTTGRDFLYKYFEIEELSQEKNFYGIGKRRLGKVRIRSVWDRLNGKSSSDVYEAAKEIWEKDGPQTIPMLIKILKHGKRGVNRTAAAYALNLMRGRGAIRALEMCVDNQLEHARIRGQAAESLAHNHRKRSHRVLLRNLHDRSKEVRFWCAFSLAEMADEEALEPLRELGAKDQRFVKGFWSASKEAKSAIRKIMKELRSRRRRHKACLFCRT
jgi:HEAT repeats/PBS lyase HEAT-like repeat